ncbi:hypothetical protein [Nostoc sp. WHI]|uniref:hypothetical protein n=1 Tax=Nostoc sp. WHI TaxID=2650611 RepID=UPI0018C636BE|nr:hypothetical protein [Nostoc sp. WHI]
MNGSLVKFSLMVKARSGREMAIAKSALLPLRYPPACASKIVSFADFSRDVEREVWFANVIREPIPTFCCI